MIMLIPIFFRCFQSHALIYFSSKDFLLISPYFCSDRAGERSKTTDFRHRELRHQQTATRWNLREESASDQGCHRPGKERLSCSAQFYTYFVLFFTFVLFIRSTFPYGTTLTVDTYTYWISKLSLKPMRSLNFDSILILYDFNFKTIA